MSKPKIKFYFPRWIFPKNLGDSLIATFVPKLLKREYHDSFLEVITHGFLVDLLRLDPNVDSVREPYLDELNLNYQQYAFSNKNDELIKVVYPDWHPNTFVFWRENASLFENHPSINIITINYLLQLGLEHLAFSDIDFAPISYVPINKKESESINVGIAPATKMSGRSSPHPFCDGVGLRFNGPNGIDSWKRLVSTLKAGNNKVRVFEFSYENFGLGDVHFPDNGDVFSLLDNVDQMDFGVMSDGGLHHAFNIRKKPVVLFQACLVNKVEFFKLGNTFFPEHLHLECRKHCPSYFHQVFGGENKSLTCKKECENLSPEKLGKYILEEVIK